MGRVTSGQSPIIALGAVKATLDTILEIVAKINLQTTIDCFSR
jgi:hypothetical protein